VKWLEISLTLEGELVEPVADLLSRIAPGGVAVEAGQIEEDDLEGHPVGRVVVRAYLPQDLNLEERKRRTEEGLWHLGRIRPLPAPVCRAVDEEDWAEAWKAHYQPIAIGRRLLILPAWIPAQSPDRLPLILDPGMAFGTGAHPTTQMMLAAIEDYLQPGQTVADLGCGSGILSIAAARLGARHALALDIDAQAVESARQNAQRNGLADRIQVERGSLERLLEEVERGGLAFDLVLANILAPVLHDMLLRGLGRSVSPGGKLILSGILDYQAEPLADEASRLGLNPTETRSYADWRALVFERQSPPAWEATG
jgi:ribosomal protein L11 methyltransferase